MYIHMCISLSIHICVYIYIYIYIHTHTHIQALVQLFEGFEQLSSPVLTLLLDVPWVGASTRRP